MRVWILEFVNSRGVSKVIGAFSSESKTLEAARILEKEDPEIYKGPKTHWIHRNLKLDEFFM